ncbi:hypothetical protein BH23ACT10_BH23ACT10_29990 [soil metagenome]
MTSPPPPSKRSTLEPPLWRNGFDVDGEPGGPIRLAQVNRTFFALTSVLHYRGDTGLDGRVPSATLDTIRTLDPADHPNGVFLTDLGSVPGPTRWFLGSYGEHTPAVIIHDWLIPVAQTNGLAGMTDAFADRYLRFMLAEIGVRWLRRWIMWAAVALRTRIAAGGVKRLFVLVWLVAALAGIATFLYTATFGDVSRVTVAAGLAPAVFAGLWGRQYGAGLIAGIAAPWLLPPTVLAVIGYAIYVVLEWIAGRVLGRAGRRPAEGGTYLPEGM